jgi:hypothetical protein
MNEAHHVRRRRRLFIVVARTTADAVLPSTLHFTGRNRGFQLMKRTPFEMELICNIPILPTTARTGVVRVNASSRQYGKKPQKEKTGE